MGRSALAARITLIAAAMVLLAGVVSASVPGLFTSSHRAPEGAVAPTPSTTAPASTPSTASTPTTAPTPTTASAATTVPASSPAPTGTPAGSPGAQPPPSVPISQSTTLARTGTHTRTLVPGGLALIMLGGVLVLSQRPEPYAPRHLQRRRRRSGPHRAGRSA